MRYEINLLHLYKFAPFLLRNGTNREIWVFLLYLRKKLSWGADVFYMR